MKTIVGVRFRHAGKSFYYDPGELELAVGTEVIVRAGEGLEYGKVSIPPIEKEESELPAIIKNIERIATDEDRAIVRENTEKEEQAYRICKRKIAELELPMKLIQAEYAFDRKKLLFYFTAEGRVDFRELVRLLASEFRTRIELRQIGVRDETRLLGGIGICGRPLCCSTYLAGFAPVSIKMAKEQNLSLNPSKISGVCGRLMCCLSHEEEVYEYLNRTMPRSGDYATDIEGKTGTIRSVNILKQTVLVLFEDGDSREMKEYPVTELGITNRRQGPPSPEAVEEILKKLEAAEEQKLKEELALVSDDTDYDDFSGTQTDTDAEDESAESSGKEHKNKDKSRDKGRFNRKNKGSGADDKKRADRSDKDKASDKGSGQEGRERRRKNKRDDRKGESSGGKHKGKFEDDNRPKDRSDRKPSDKSPEKKGSSKHKKNKGKDRQAQKPKQEDTAKRKDNVIRNGGYSRGYRTDRKDQ